ncbi:MAG TPA: sugar ABC transporter permease [Roseiflexaceae bacterium]|nr:sugar ABC transporter permease [Roseiflexaceae bacterium]
MAQASQDPVVSAALRRAAARRRYWTNDRLISVGLISPSVLAIAVFVYYFIARTAYISLVRWNDLAPDFTWVGLRNYSRLFQTERFQIDVHNTIVFTLVFIVGCLAVGLLLATLLDLRVRGEAIFRTIFMFPLAISFIVTGVAWRWLESPTSGINLLFDSVGLGFLKSGWFTDPRIGILAVVLAAVWQMSGYVMAMYLAGLRGIPDEIREAARVDGANEWQIFRGILLPLLQPITLSAVIILGHISLKIFDLTKAMTGPGPGFSSDVPALFMYETTFFGSHFAQGAAIAMVLLIFVSVLIVPYLVYNTRNEVHQ